jgi:hypothetical protein
MSSLLYYSISSNFTEDEITKLDKQVSRLLIFHRTTFEFKA